MSNIINYFESAVKDNSEKTALFHKGVGWSYRELNEKSNQLAQFLSATGIVKNDIVAISLDNGIQNILTIIALLKIGAVYMPVDSNFPAERISYMLKDAAPKTVLTDASSQHLFGNYTTLVLENHTDAINQFNKEKISENVSGDFVYTLFTSGSMGKPKGVLMKQEALCNLIAWQIKDSTMSANSRTLQFSPLTFDVSFQEIFCTLSIGGTLCLIDDELRLDASALLDFIATHQINRLFLPFVALQALCDLGVAAGKFPQSLQEVMTAGEQLKITPQIITFFSKIQGLKLFNQYGPTEAHVVSCLTLEGNPADWTELPSIGKPISNVTIYILDEQQKLVANGAVGELCIGGIALSQGYVNQPELTAEKFIAWKSANHQTERIYKTGDLAKFLPDGTIEFLGRKDEQVKVRGYRIELGEIETCLLQQNTLANAVVVAQGKDTAQLRIVAYLVSKNDKKNTEEIRKHLQQQLPEYMIPSLFVWIDELPKTASGKVDKKALPIPDASAQLNHAFVAPQTVTEKMLSELWKDVLQMDRAGAEDNFFELGGTSLLALKMVAQLQTRYQKKLSVIKLYQHPKLKDLAAFMDGKTTVKKNKQFSKNRNGDVAVIGMAGRFPGATTIEELWSLLQEGKETVSFFSDGELDASLPSSLTENPDYVKSRGIIKDVKKFDALFFDIYPNLAKLMDPQQRIFLEIAWEVLEQTGYSQEGSEHTIGVFAGVNSNTYFIKNILSHPELIENTGDLQATFFNDKDYVATRTSYTFDLKGPAVNIQAACATSLVAIAQAVQSIRNGQCDMALAGGASVNVPVNSGHLYEEGAMFSKDGHCRPFDAAATGTSFSDGAGVVLLKNKEQALQDGDTIYAVIKGVGISNDGGGKGSFMAPSAEGQSAAISMAIADAGIDAKEISYIETHGTATPLGDPIEMEGLNLAFGEQEKKQYCAIGSVKSNFGHLTIASGVAGFIKTCLSLHHKKLLPSINFEKPNPHIDFANSPFYVNATLQNWETRNKRIAGVSSFGVGGTNAHVILEENDTSVTSVSSAETRAAQLICWSANSEKSLDGYGKKLTEHFALNTNCSPADVAFTLHATRRVFNHRRFVVADNAHDFSAQINDASALITQTKKLTNKPPHIVFMFPGQGDQYVNMGKSLYQSEKVFREAVDECAALLKTVLNENILDVLYPEVADENAQTKINQTRYSQPALFTIGYALGKLWMSWGVVPAAFVGHSIGEFVAAYFSGVFTLQDAIKIIATRGSMMNDLPGGSMLSVRLSYEEVQPYLTDKVALAAANSPKLCVVAGTHEAIAALSQTLNEKEIPNRILATSHAFHSYMMDAVVAPFETMLKTITFNEPLIPIASSVTGEWLAKEEAMSTAYWAQHLRKPVMFGKAVQKLIDESYHLFLEVGPAKSVATLARQQANEKTIAAISSFEKEENVLASNKAILMALGQLWINGYDPLWASFYENETRQKLVNLPTYAFDKKEYWVEALPKENLQTTSEVTEETTTQENIEETGVSQKDQLIEKIKEVLENASGIDVNTATPDMSFIQIGLDSLSLTQVALMLKKQFAVAITFRQLNEEIGTIELLANYLQTQLPETATFTTAAKKKITLTAELSTEEEKEIKKPFGAIARIEKKSTALTGEQQQFLAELTQRYNQKTKASKAYTQEHRAHMADPRVVSGFKPATKELVYSLVVKKSKGCRIWDIDGNEYIDALNGFGSSMLGYQPDFLKQALLHQIDNGYEIGPQHELAGDVCKMIAEFTKFDRSALCNTGSEAVLGAMRIARTVTGRSLIVAFTGSYHGINDEVIARGSKKLKSYPAAPGIMPEAVQNMLFLDYGTEESLRIIEARAHEIAAVLVEPIQSRRCDFQPVAFLKKLRKITEDADTVLIFDEVISGFRFHIGGAQALFGVQADVATYGKVIGGGMSIGAIAGKKKFMDALDGGWWQYGDESIPEAGVTYFAGTFVRHPLALATAKATLDYFKQEGPSLQENLNNKAKRLADALNAICRKMSVPMYVAQFGSIWRIHYKEEFAYSELIFALMRFKGIHILEGFPCFVTTAHTDVDIQEIIKCFETSLAEMKQVHLIPEFKHPVPDKHDALNVPPFPNARLGKDKDGNPAWFIPDENNPGKYLQIKEE